MTAPIDAARLAAFQEGLWLAEIAREDDRTLAVTLAGPRGLVVGVCEGVQVLGLSFESLDPDVLPRELIIERTVELGPNTDFDADEEIAARFLTIDARIAADVARASRSTWLEGDAANLHAAPLVMDLRVESWVLAPCPIDLHLLIGCSSFGLHDENGELDVAPRAAAGAEGPGPAQDAEPPYRAPDEPAWQLEPGDLPEGLERTLRGFFTAGLDDDFAALAGVFPDLGCGRAERRAWLARHFHSLHDWGYARAIDSWKQEGDLACVRVRGIVHQRPEDGIEALNEECVWSFSLGREDDGWFVRNFACAWPSVGGAPQIPLADKPWIVSWRGGAIS